MGVMAGLATALLDINPPDADVKYDWLSAKAGISSNAYTDILTLGENEGVDLIVHYPYGAERPFPHPRTPGAVFLALPMLLIEFDDLFAVSVGVTVGIAVLVVAVLTSSLGARKQFGVFALLAASALFVTTLRYAGQSMIVAGAVIAAWMLYQRRRDLPAGALIAMAGVLALSPDSDRPHVVAAALQGSGLHSGGSDALTSAGLMLRGVSLGDSGDALAHGGDVWFSLLSNGSMAAFLARWGVDWWVGTAIAVLSSAALITWARGRQSGRLLEDPVIWLALALLLLPLSWVSYDVVLIAGLVGGLWSPGEGTSHSQPEHLGSVDRDEHCHARVQRPSAGPGRGHGCAHVRSASNPGLRLGRRRSRVEWFAVPARRVWRRPRGVLAIPGDALIRLESTPGLDP